MLTVLTKSYNTTNYNQKEKIQSIARDYQIRLQTNKTLYAEVGITTERLETDDEFYSLGILSDYTEFYTFPQDLLIEKDEASLGYKGEQMLVDIQFYLSSDIIEHKR